MILMSNPDSIRQKFKCEVCSAKVEQVPKYVNGKLSCTGCFSEGRVNSKQKYYRTYPATPRKANFGNRPTGRRGPRGRRSNAPKEILKLLKMNPELTKEIIRGEE